MFDRNPTLKYRMTDRLMKIEWYFSDRFLMKKSVGLLMQRSTAEMMKQWKRFVVDRTDKSSMKNSIGMSNLEPTHTMKLPSTMLVVRQLVRKYASFFIIYQSSIFEKDICRTTRLVCRTQDRFAQWNLCWQYQSKTSTTGMSFLFVDRKMNLLRNEDLWWKISMERKSENWFAQWRSDWTT